MSLLCTSQTRLHQHLCSGSCEKGKEKIKIYFSTNLTSGKGEPATIISNKNPSSIENLPKTTKYKYNLFCYLSEFDNMTQNENGKFCQISSRFILWIDWTHPRDGKMANLSFPDIFHVKLFKNCSGEKMKSIYQLNSMFSAYFMWSQEK